jgi:hypothetical protein
MLLRLLTNLQGYTFIYRYKASYNNNGTGGDPRRGTQVRNIQRIGGDQRNKEYRAATQRRL